MNALVAAWNGACAYCGRPFDERVETEHIEPLSRGGEDVPENIVPVCRGCNVKKRDLFLLEWVCVQYGLLKRGHTAKTLRVAPANHRPWPDFGLRHPEWAPSIEWINAIGRRVA